MIKKSKKKQEYKILKIDIVEYNKEAGDKLIIRVGDDKNDPSQQDIMKLGEVFNDLINGTVKAIYIPHYVNITIMKKGGKN